MKKKSLIGKQTTEEIVEGILGMTEEEALLLDKEEAEAEIEEARILAEEEKETPEEKAERLALAKTKEEEEEEAALLLLEEERIAGLSDEERLEEIAAAEKAAEKETEEEDDNFTFGGDPDDEEEDDDKKKQKKTNTQITDEAFFELASIRLGRSITSYDDLNKELPAEFANEQLGVLNNYVKETGRDVFEWFAMSKLNVEGMNDEQLVKAQLGIKYPNLLQHEINRKFDRTYKMNTENDTEDDIADAKLDLKIDAGIARTDISKIVEGYKMPVKQERKTDDAVELRKAARVKEAYVSQMVKDVDSIETLTFNVGDSKVKYKPSRADRKQMKISNQNLETFFDQFRDKNGDLDTNALSRGLWLATSGNVEKLLLGVKSRFKAEGKGGQIRKIKNTKLPKKDGKKGKEKSEEQTQDQIDLETAILTETRIGGKGMKIQF